MNSQSSYRLIDVRGMPLGFVVLYYISVSIRRTRACAGISTDLGPHVLKLARDEAAFGVECARVGSVLVSVDRLYVDAQKGVRDVADGEPEKKRVNVRNAATSDRLTW